MEPKNITEPTLIRKGQGAQFNPSNTFLKGQLTKENTEAIDDWEETASPTHFIQTEAKSIVNPVKSPDVGMAYSLNPYQGCEHGCIYCYARNSHEYWGYSAGIDFEREILVKKRAPALFREFLNKKSWVVTPISLSGNTDCYQPIERKYKLTRQLLQIALEFNQPISLITKNSLILRDLDILQALSAKNLCQVYISVTSLDEKLRLKMEPRTASAKQRLKTIADLSSAGVPVGVMAAPIIPGLNDSEIPHLLKAAAQQGAKWAGYTIVRLNGQVEVIFEDWLRKTFADRADKIWHGIQDCHGGTVHDSIFGQRMKGTGHLAAIIRQVFTVHCRINSLNLTKMELDCSLFAPPGQGRQLSLF